MTTFIKTILFSILAFFAPVGLIMMTIMLAVFADTITAVALTKKKFNSRSLRIGLISKMISYEAAVLLFFLIDYTMINDAMLTVFSVPYVLTKIVGLFIIGIEVISMDEKIRVRYGDDKGVIQRFKNFVKSIKKIKDSL